MAACELAHVRRARDGEHYCEASVLRQLPEHEVVSEHDLPATQSAHAATLFL
jgi:hypothetical protein